MPILRNPGFEFGFHPEACSTCAGNCCRGPSGYIWINQMDIFDISLFLNITQVDFIHDYTIRVGNQYSLIEQDLGTDHPCIFFDLEQENCRIYGVRPKQCRTFPFWPENKLRKEILQKNCPGIID